MSKTYIPTGYRSALDLYETQRAIGMIKLKFADNLSKADENLKYADLGFREGAVPVSNVLEAQTAWLSAHTDVLDARIEWKLCEVYLKKAYGVLRNF